LQLIPVDVEYVEHRPYVCMSGMALRPNKTDGSFEMDAKQYTSQYKAMKELSIFPIRAHFPSKRWKGVKPLPGYNVNVCVEGFLYGLEKDNSDRPIRFLLEVDNIHFLNPPGSPQKGLPSTPTTNPSPRFRWTYDDSTTQSADASSEGGDYGGEIYENSQGAEAEMSPRPAKRRR
jgi:hypothetical protein